MNKEAEIVNALAHTFTLVVPEAVLVLTACLLFVGGLFRSDRRLWAEVALAGLALAWLALANGPRPGGSPTQAEIYAAPLFLDPLAWLVKAIALTFGILLVLVSWNEVPDGPSADYYACLLIVTAGLCLTGSANELVTLFLALELIGIPTYVLLYLPRGGNAAREAATKYFLLSVFSSAFLLFGFSYLYGLAGTTNVPALVNALNQGEADVAGMLRILPVDDAATRSALLHSAAPWRGLALVALVMIVAGLGFKITAVPFHFYAPDVYQGAPTAGAALLAFVPKAAGFVALIRLLGFVWAGKTDSGAAFGPQMPGLLWILAVVTMSLGNVLALLQSNIKRLLAYSSVAHAGYMLIGLAVAHDFELSEPAVFAGMVPVPGGIEAILFYLVGYGAMTIGAFAVLAYLSTSERPVEMEDDLAGLGTSHPGVAALLAVFLFSLIGVPLTAGFVGKALLFLGPLTVTGEHTLLFRWLVLIGAVNAAIGGWYYLRILAKMYLHLPIKPLEKPRPGPVLAAVWLCAALTLFLGIYPQPMVQAVREAVNRPNYPPAETRAER